MGAMLPALSATASTGRRKATSQPQPEPLILGLVPDQPAPGAATNRAHKAVYCRQHAAELSQPGCLTGTCAARPAEAGEQVPQGTAMPAGEPAARHTSSVARRYSAGERHGCATLSVAGSGHDDRRRPGLRAS
jgi:hypothetical protein